MPATGRIRRFFLGQPRGVYLIFSLEFWERFSYYGFLSILVLWLTAVPARGGLGWSEQAAVLLVGYFIGIVWIAPVAGGWLADRGLGARRAIVFGAIGLALGNALLASAAFLVARSTPMLVNAVFVAGLAVMIVGAGLFKSNASSLLSAQFDADDPLRGDGFTLFYMGINLGALAAPFGAGTLGELWGWGYGFAIAAGGMTLGLIVFLVFADRALRATPKASTRTSRDPARRSGDGLFIVLALIPFATVFWSGMMQYSGIVTLFTAEDVSREAFGLTVPATWFLSINPFVILVCGPFVAASWARRDAAAGRDMFLVKVVVALGAMATAFLILALAALERTAAGASPIAVLAFWVLLTLGELSLMPVGLALVGRLAPPRLVGTLMGAWLMTMGIGSVVAGWLGALGPSLGRPAVFAITAVLGATAAALLALLAPMLTRRAARMVTA